MSIVYAKLIAILFANALSEKPELAPKPRYKIVEVCPEEDEDGESCDDNDDDSCECEEVVRRVH